MAYSVKPESLKLSLGNWSRSLTSFLNLGCSGCFSALLAVVVIAVLAWQDVLASPNSAGSFLSLVVKVALPLFLALTFSAYVVKRFSETRSQAEKISTEASSLLAGVHSHAQYLAYKAELAAQALRRADHEFSEGAISPFWDAIEAAAAELAECQVSNDWIATGATRYDGILAQRDHDFPDCFAAIEVLPDCRPLLNEMYRLVRAAQKDFRFANIWEHRQTRKVLIAGFTSLGEAIRRLEDTVARSIASLEAMMLARTVLMQANPAIQRRVVRFLVPGLAR